MDPRVAEDLWGEDSNVRFSSSYAPFGKAKRVEGGYVLEGRWSWSSGCDHATWVILGAVVEMENGEANQLALMVGPGDYEIDHSSWDFAGLSGTGSKDVTVNGAFIPCYRVHNINESYLMTEPGRAAFTADTYKLPFGTVFGLTLTSVMVGMAEGAFDFYVDYVSKRTSAYTGASFKEDPLAQQVLAEAHSLVDGAVLRLNRDADEMANYAVRGEKVPLNRRVFYKWDAANIVRQCRDAVNLLTANSGGSMFNRSCIMQRYFRDINTGSNHLFVNPQKGSVNFARFMLGGENQDLMI